MKKAEHQQLTLFDTPAPTEQGQTKRKEHRAPKAEKPQQIAHHHIEVGYSDGSREITCTASGRSPESYRQDQLYAGFIGPGVATFEECFICNPKSQGRK